MSRTLEPAAKADPATPAPPPPSSRLLQGLIILLCGLLGFALVAQIRSNQELDYRLVGEREEDLTRILADLSSDSDRLAREIAQLQLTLYALEDEQEGEEVALRSLQRRLDDLRILTGVAPAEGEGVTLTVDDPQRLVGQEQLVDAVQELRDAGAEAIAINGTRLVVSSAFVTRDGRLLLDGQPLVPPFRISAIGKGETMARALAIPGGVTDTMTAPGAVTADVEVLAQLTLPARSDPAPFQYAVPVPPETGESSG